MFFLNGLHRWTLVFRPRLICGRSRFVDTAKTSAVCRQTTCGFAAHFCALKLHFFVPAHYPQPGRAGTKSSLSSRPGCSLLLQGLSPPHPRDTKTRNFSAVRRFRTLVSQRRLANKAPKGGDVRPARRFSALQRRETRRFVNKAPKGGDAESRPFPRPALPGWGIGRRVEMRGAEF